MFLDFDALDRFLTAACEHYEKVAPTVRDYCDGLYMRLHENTAAVRVAEIMFVARLRENGIWMQPNHAANAVYHLMERLGMDVTGQAGF